MKQALMVMKQFSALTVAVGSRNCTWDARTEGCACTLDQCQFPVFSKNLVFVFRCAGSSLLYGLFSGCGEWRPLSSCGSWASHCGDFSRCRAWVLGHAGFNSCSTWS